MTTENFGNGNQTINAGSNLTISVGNGNDTITIGSNDVLTVGNGNDTITAGSDDQITDGNGHDTIVAGDNSTVIDGNGTDNITVGANSSVTDGNGNDSITAGANSSITAGNGNKVLTAGDNSTITAGNGNNTVVAGANNQITLGNGNANVDLGASDTVHVGAGNADFAFQTPTTPTLAAPPTLSVNEDGTIALPIGVGFGPGFGNDTIFGFSSGPDVLTFFTSQFANFAAVIADAAQVGSDTVITADASDTITLKNTQLSSLSASNFAFVSKAADPISVTITGIPSDATLSDTAGPLTVVGGSITLTQAQLAGLALTAGEVITTTLTVTATDTVSGHSVSQNIALTVNPVAPTLTLASNSLSVNEDGGSVALGISETPFDPRDTVAITISGVPADATLSAGTNNGGGTWTLTPAQLAGLTLTAGEETSTTLTVTATNTLGSTASTSKTISLSVVDVPPVITSGAATGTFDEPGADSVGAIITFTDDLDDTHTVSEGSPTFMWSGGMLTAAQIATLTAASSLALAETDSTGIGNGSIAWNYSIDDGTLGFLQANQTLTVTYAVTLTGDSGASAEQDVTVTITHKDNPPVFTSGPDFVSLSEQPNTTGSGAPDTATPASLTFTDADQNDTHTVSVAVNSELWSGGTSIPTATQSALNGALATTLNDSTGTGSGSVDLNFSIPDDDVDFLAAGETLTVSYGVTVTDSANASATQTVTVEIDGTNDAPMISSGPETGSLQEQPGVSGSPTPDTTTGSLAFTDVDLNDTHQVSVALDSAAWSTGQDIPDATQAALATALTTALSDSTGSGSGSINWTFSIPDEDLDFLATGDTLTATYNVTVQDPSGATSTQTVTLNMAGSTDPIVVNSAAATVVDTPFPDNGLVVAVGNAVSDVGDSPGDQGGGLTVTSINGSAANVDAPVAGTYGTLVMDSSGFYTYTANSIDQLTTGQNPTDQFTFTVDNGLGQSQSTTLTFNIVGGDDNPIITSADTVGSVTQNLGSSILVNGGFEDGGLAGWTAGSDISAQELFIGGAFGNVSTLLGPTPAATQETLSQSVQTVAGQAYTLDFYLTGDVDAGSNSIAVDWNGTPVTMEPTSPVLTNNNFSGGFTEYTADVTGTGNPDSLSFTYATDGSGMYLDQVTLDPQNNSTTQNANGVINFSDVETADTHMASFTPEDSGYLGTFSLAPVNESGGSGSVGWSFTVNNSDLSSLMAGQVQLQTYDVAIADNHGGSAVQPVTIALHAAAA